MADSGDMELEGEDAATGSSGAQAVRKNIAITLKPGTKTQGRAKKTAGRGKKAAKLKASQEKAEQERARRECEGSHMDVSLLPIKISSSPPEPRHQNQKLRWDHQVNLIGEKVVDPLIHCCEKCAVPILIFGRMIPCKHVFCFDCAKKTEKNCPRCSEGVTRIEQSALGTVFVCTFGGPKHIKSGCHRTYLSQRDLQAHIDYRHLRTHLAPDLRGHAPREYAHAPPPRTEPPAHMVYHQRSMSDGMMQQMHPRPPITPPAPLQHHVPGMLMSGGHQGPPLGHQGPVQQGPPPGHQQGPPPGHQGPPQGHQGPPPQGHQGSPSGHLGPPGHQGPMPGHQGLPPPVQQTQGVPMSIESYHTIPVMSSSRTNLISIPVQDENSYQRIGGSPQQGAPPGHYPPTNSTIDYIKSHPPPMSVQPPHISAQSPVMTQPPMMASSVVNTPPQVVLPPHFSSPQLPYREEHQQPQFIQQGGLPNPRWPVMSAPSATIIQGGMPVQVQVPMNAPPPRNMCVVPPAGIVHSQPPPTVMPGTMLVTRPPPQGLPPQNRMPPPAGMMPSQGGMPPAVGMMCGPPPPQHPPSLGPTSQPRYYQ